MKYIVKVENKKVFSTNELNEALEVITAIRNHDSSMKRFGLSKYPYIADFLNPMSELIPGFPYSLLIGPIAVLIYFVYSLFRSIKSGSQSVIKDEKEKK